MKKLLFLSISFLISITLSGQKSNIPKNIILMIGDGMGFNQIQAASTVKGSRLFMEEFPYTGFLKTHSSNNYTTDSAAGGTAIACGTKTNNGMIGVSPDTIILNSILMESKEKGMNTGIVTTCNLTHATPAAFYAHVPSRTLSENIAKWFSESEINAAVGGGRSSLENRSDGRNISEEMRNKGYKVVYSIDEAKQIQTENMLVLLAEDHPEKVMDGRDYLPSAVNLIINFLHKNNKGFFLMVEGSQIDWGGHQNDQQYVITETIDFDNAVGKALEFAKRDGNTLVIVTADHETGGTSIKDGSVNDKEILLTFNTNWHSAALVPVFAYGPGAENFSGWYDNTQIKTKITKIMHWK